MNAANPATDMLRILSPSDASSPPPGAREMAQAEMDRNPACGPDISGLTKGMAAGDETFFGIFYEHYYDRLFRYLIVLTRGDESHTRDLLQVTLVKVLRSIKPFVEECQLWQWLKTIARNTFLDSIRQASRSPNLIPLFEADAGHTQAPIDDDEQRLLLEALDACLSDLAPHDRELVDACYVRNLGQQAAAEQLDTTAKAVESRLARIRHKLRLAILKRLRHENL